MNIHKLLETNCKLIVIKRQNINNVFSFGCIECGGQREETNKILSNFHSLDTAKSQGTNVSITICFSLSNV